MKSVTPDTEILTINNWCKAQDLDIKNKIAIVNYKSGNIISFNNINKINKNQEDYIYLFTSNEMPFSQAVSRNTILHKMDDEFSDEYFQYAKDIKYLNENFIYSAGYKKDGKTELDKLDKILILISISSAVIEETTNELIFGFTSLANGVDTNIINTAKELNLKTKWNNHGEYCLELNVDKNLIKDIDFINLNWIELDEVNYRWILKTISSLSNLTTPNMFKKQGLLQYRSDNKQEISKLQALCSISGLSSKVTYTPKRKKKYLLEMFDNPLKKCKDITRTILPYYDEVCNIDILNEGIIIKHGDNVSIL